MTPRSRSTETALLAGWLFADLLLALALLFLGAIRGDTVTVGVGLAETESPTILEPQEGALIGSSELVIRGSSDPDTLVTVRVDGQDRCGIQALGGQWSCVVAGLAGESQHTVAAVAAYTGGPASQPAIRRFFVDTEAPALTVRVTPDRLSPGTQTLRVEGSCSETGIPVHVSIGALALEAICSSEHRYAIDVTNAESLLDTGMRVAVTQIDTAGNLSAGEVGLSVARSGIERSPAPVCVRLTSRGGFLDGNAAVLEDVRRQLGEQLDGYQQRRAGIVLTFGVASTVQEGNRFAEAMNAFLIHYDVYMFGESWLRPFWHSPSRCEGGADLDIEIFYLVD